MHRRARTHTIVTGQMDMCVHYLNRGQVEGIGVRKKLWDSRFEFCLFTIGKGKGLCDREKMDRNG